MNNKESRLKSLFDYQHYADNKRLAQLIEDTERRYHKDKQQELSDEQLEVWAAGEDIPAKPPVNGENLNREQGSGAIKVIAVPVNPNPDSAGGAPYGK